MSSDWSFVLTCVRIGVVPAFIVSIILLWLVMPKSIRLLIFTTLAVHWGYVFHGMATSDELSRYALYNPHALHLSPAQLWFDLGLINTVGIVFGLLLLPVAYVEFVRPERPDPVYSVFDPVELD